MNTELLANIAALAAARTMEIMMAKSGATAEAIMATIVADPDGNTARYFANMVGTAMAEVPAMLAQGA